MSVRAVRTGLARSGSLRPRPLPENTRPLFPTGAQPSAPAPAAEARELWMGLHFPWLSIEALGPPSNVGAPRVIVELQGQTQFVTAVCEVAERSGVRLGMSMAAALSLVPNLETQVRHELREQQLLERLAQRAQRFTPRVSIVPPDGLVLEVKGSLHLFGGAEALSRTVETECNALGARPLFSLAPGPLAALACARGGKNVLVTQPAHLMGQLASLSLATLRWPPEILQRLRQIGVYTVGAALRLPRGGFARRFGKAQLTTLDRLAGREADLRAAFQPRERFKRSYPLLFDLEHHESILNTLAPLMTELGEFLRSRQCGITRLDCLLTHRHAPVTRCVLKLAAPATNADHLTKLLGEKLATLSLPEPVRACELRSGLLVSHAPLAHSLWRPGEYGSEAGPEAAEIIEHLRSRLGHEAVYGLRLMQSHRPESAWAVTDPDPLVCEKRPGGGGVAAEKSSRPPWPAFRRPAWLLMRPRPLKEQEGFPCHHGPLKLLGGPERLETAWWDGGDIARDYYQARDLQGVRLWIFRERASPHRWFLHGIFG